jgi:hypothetical protein
MFEMSSTNFFISEGEDVLKMFKDEKFSKNLQILYERCLHKTIFQSMEFLSSWYECKFSDYHPLVVYYISNDIIEGALFLAISKDSKGKVNAANVKIIGAGEYDAEYQSWLVRNDLESEFLPRAFKLIFSKFPKSKIVFRFIHEWKSLIWIEDDKYWKNYCVIQKYRRPLIEMDHPDYLGLFKKRHLKAKYNRFAKAGRMVLEEIKERNRFEIVFDEVMVLYDFRQGALFNKKPSEINPHRKKLFLSLFEKGILHVSILKLDEEITSCIIGMQDGKWMHLAGLITYSPRFSKLSPGLVHIYLLAKYLEKSGFNYFDLTPGDDSYKERMASNADEVFELTISLDSKFKLKRKLRKYFHKFLLYNGIRPMSFNLKIQKSFYLFKSRISRIKAIIQSTKKQFSLPKRFDQNYLEKNKIEDLLCYEDKMGISRWEFLENAFRKIESGLFFYTYTINGQLLACIWIIPSIPNINIDKGNATFELINESDHYFHYSLNDQKKEIFKIIGNLNSIE